MIKVSLIFFACAAMVCVLNAQHCPNLETDIDYNGNDITFTYATSASNCCYLCSVNPLCKSFTFVSASQTCWLKSAAAQNRLRAIGRISGVVNPVTNPPVTAAPITVTVTHPLPTTTVAPVTSTAAPATTTTTTKGYGCYVENSINYFGNDFYSTFIDTPSECCNLCGRTPSCVVWSYLTIEKFCYLKNRVPSLENRQNYSSIISGVVTLR